MGIDPTRNKGDYSLMIKRGKDMASEQHNETIKLVKQIETKQHNNPEQPARISAEGQTKTIRNPTKFWHNLNQDYVDNL